MSLTEFYYRKIIENTGLSRKEIKELIEEKTDSNKVITEENALKIIGKELCVDFGTIGIENFF